jgi:hypothetical protein
MGTNVWYSCYSVIKFFVSDARVVTCHTKHLECVHRSDLVASVQLVDIVHQSG